MQKMRSQSTPFLSTFLARYLLNCSQVISFLPKPETLLITSWISSSVRLYLSWSEILFKSENSSNYFSLGSTKVNIALLPFSLKGFPTFSVTNFRKVSKSTHYPARSALTAVKASKMILYFLSKPKVLAVFKISATSHCRLLSQYKLNISKKS